MDKMEYTYRQVPEFKEQFYKMSELSKEQRDAVLAEQIGREVDMHNEMGAKGWRYMYANGGNFVYGRTVEDDIWSRE